MSIPRFPNNIFFIELVEEEGNNGIFKVNYFLSNVRQTLKILEKLNYQMDLEYERTLRGKEHKVSRLINKEERLIIELLETKYNKQGRKIESNMPGNIHCCFKVKDISFLYNVLCSSGAKALGLPTKITHGLNKGASAGYLKINDMIIELFEAPPI